MKISTIATELDVLKLIADSYYQKNSLFENQKNDKNPNQVTRDENHV